MLLRLKKSLYGDRVASLAWDETQSKWLTNPEIGFARLPSEESIYISRGLGTTLSQYKTRYTTNYILPLILPRRNGLRKPLKLVLDHGEASALGDARL
jgi:hypothetical protein